MKDITLQELLEAGCHFGHKTNRWHPKARAFIYKAVGDTHIIDLVKTKEGLEKAIQFVRDLGKNGKNILFVGTKRQARGIIREAAEKSTAFYLASRWIGGFITNWNEVKKNIEKLKGLREKMKDEDEMSKYTKKEKLIMMQEIGKLASVYQGVIELGSIPDALFIVDIKKEAGAVKEAVAANIPIVAVVDTNCDPTDIDYVIPANDDAVGSVKLITSAIAAAFKEGESRNLKPEEKKGDLKKPEKVKETKEIKK